jgi:hypothetical protein
MLFVWSSINGVLSAMCKCISRYKIDSRELEYHIKHTYTISSRIGAFTVYNFE